MGARVGITSENVELLSNIFVEWHKADSESYSNDSSRERLGKSAFWLASMYLADLIDLDQPEKIVLETGDNPVEATEFGLYREDPDPLQAEKYEFAAHTALPLNASFRREHTQSYLHEYYVGNNVFPLMIATSALAKTLAERGKLIIVPRDEADSLIPEYSKPLGA